jgi:hypothetical protein
MPNASTIRVNRCHCTALGRLLLLAGCLAPTLVWPFGSISTAGDGGDPSQAAAAAPPAGPLTLSFARLDFQQQRQLTDALGVEHGRVRLICELTADQAQQLESLSLRRLLQRCEQLHQQAAPDREQAAQAEPALFAKIAKAVAGLVAAPPNQAQPQAQFETLKELLLDQFDRELQELLGEVQWDRYQQERLAREAFEFQTNSDLLLMIIDREIRLADSQREPIRQATRSWVNQHASSLQFYYQNEDYVPDISREIEPLVTPAQWEHWKQRRTVNISGHFQTGWSERLKKHFLPETP